WKVFLRTDPLYYGYLWNPLLPILEDTVGYKAASPAFIKNINKFPATIAAHQKLEPITFISNEASDSLNIVLSLRICPKNETLTKNKLQVTCRRKNNPNVDGYDFEITLRNLEANEWNTVNKQIKLSKKTRKEQFVVSIGNDGKYPFQISEVQVLTKTGPGTP
ncbi:MAG TPA: hypothetical protein VHO90_12305, partial [Bacteroidales bacterium]|nr:hypothetical protein [Bacteroidales bacterium]